MNKCFKALIVKKSDSGKYIRSIEQKKISDLPDHNVLIKVNYSSLNFKDALSATGNKGLRKNIHILPE